MSVKYSWYELKARINEINKGEVTLSNQYGMIFLLNKKGDILLRLDSLLTKKERMIDA